VFAEENHEGNVLQALRLQRAGSSLKLIEANQGNPRGLQAQELYRVDQDARELVNLASDQPELLQVIGPALALQHEAAAKGQASQQSVDVATDAPSTERLRALGYVGGDSP
jgi:hypothetical protein